MKRTWIALVLFSLVVGVCVYERLLLNDSTEYLMEKVEASQAAVLADELIQATQSAEQAADRWKADHKKLAMFISHEELQPIDEAFSSLVVNLQCEEISDFLVESSRLGEQLKQLKESEVLAVHNVF